MITGNMMPIFKHIKTISFKEKERGGVILIKTTSFGECQIDIDGSIEFIRIPVTMCRIYAADIRTSYKMGEQDFHEITFCEIGMSEMMHVSFRGDAIFSMNMGGE